MKIIEENNISVLKNKECYILFYFTASWCGPCQKIKPLLEKLSDGLDSSKIEIYMVDLDENEEIAEKYEIRSVPSFLLFKDEVLLDQCSGADIIKVHKLLKTTMK